MVLKLENKIFLIWFIGIILGFIASFLVELIIPNLIFLNALVYLILGILFWRLSPFKDFKRVLFVTGALLSDIVVSALISILIPLILGHFNLDTKIGTDYAPGFSQEKFSLIKIGYTREEVYKILGNPLLTHTGPGCDDYSWPSKWEEWDNFFRWTLVDVCYDQSGHVDMLQSGNL